MHLTIFTPTYNRAYTLPALYESLLRQTSRDFEWLIVDDGSTDDTESLVEGWMNDAGGKEYKPLSIRYIPQSNGGKHRAINRALGEPCGYLFMIVDSDDHLAHERVVDDVIKQIPFLEEHPDFCGVVGNKVHKNGRTIGTQLQYDYLDTTFIEYRQRYAIEGDRAEVIKTSVMREFPFPEIEGEKFCTEGVVWNPMAQKYRARYLNQPWMVCEYLPDGLSASLDRLMRGSPQSAMLYWAEYTKLDLIPPSRRKRGAKYFWFYFFSSPVSLRHALGMIDPRYLPILPVGWVRYLMKSRKR